MNSVDKEFIDIFNDYYPFEHYILKNPMKINHLYDDALLLEIFIPKVDAKPICDANGKIIYWSQPIEDEIFVKIKGNAGEMRFSYFDFNYHIRETIRQIILEDFGAYEWQALYMEYEDDENYNDLKELLNKQKCLIETKYGKCDIKDNFQITKIINLINSF